MSSVNSQGHVETVSYPRYTIPGHAFQGQVTSASCMFPHLALLGSEEEKAWPNNYFHEEIERIVPVKIDHGSVLLQIRS